jgi:hypothetical protein
MWTAQRPRDGENEQMTQSVWLLECRIRDSKVDEWDVSSDSIVSDDKELAEIRARSATTHSNVFEYRAVEYVRKPDSGKTGEGRGE